MSLIYSEVLKAPYNIRKVKEERILIRELDQKDLDRLRDMSKNEKIEDFLKRREKEIIKKISINLIDTEKENLEKINQQKEEIDQLKRELSTDPRKESQRVAII
jgi:hypothetical protein